MQATFYTECVVTVWNSHLKHDVFSLLLTFNYII